MIFEASSQTRMPPHDQFAPKAVRVFKKPFAGFRDIFSLADICGPIYLRLIIFGVRDDNILKISFRRKNSFRRGYNSENK